MQIVIDVDMDSCVHDAEGTDYFVPDLHTYISENMLEILKKKGKVLPKGHGKLIDLDAFLNLFQEFDLEIGTNALDGYPIIHYRFEEDNWKYMEEFTPIVVEADKEDQNEST